MREGALLFGGSPDQNLTVMDGIEVPNPYRLIVPSGPTSNRAAIW